MKMLEIQILETFLVIVGYIIVHYITKIFVNNTLKQAHLQRGRRKMIIKAVNLLAFITALVLFAAIWGLKQNEIAVFVGTILTALGIAFVAQWSLLSNVTSSLLLFFNHPVKIGDTLKVLDKDYVAEGEVIDLTYFYVLLRTEDGKIITIPNSHLFQKSVSVQSKKDTKHSSN